MTSERTGVIKTFMDLVQVDSPTFHEEKMAREVYKRLTEMKLLPKIDKEGNVLVLLDGDPAKETFMLNAHLDTVQKLDHHIKPHIDAKGWIRSDGNTILGADNKTAVAAILETLDLLISGNGNHHPLEIAFTVSEESGNHGAHGLDYKELKAKRGYIFDASDREFGSMILSSPAYMRFDLKIVGRNSHASKPEDAVNVLPILAKSLIKTKLGRIDPRTLVNIGIVSVGEVDGPVNTVPGELILSGEVRSMDEKRLKEVADELVVNFQEEAKDVGGNVEVKLVRENGSFEFSKDDDFVIRTIETLKKMQVKPSFINSWGCYEANIFAEHGIMMLNLADGSLDSHTTAERVRVSDLENLQRMIYRLVTD